MHKKFLLLFIVLSITAQAQYTIKGKLEPTSEYKWVILYQLKGANQVYLSNTTIEDGSFELKFPEKNEPGMYRLTYDLENGGYVDFLYNSENIELKFDPTFPSGTLQFEVSNENKILTEYFDKSEISQQKLDSLQVVYFRLQNEDEKSKTAKLFKKELKEKNGIQEMYEELSNGKLANHFIKANRKHLPNEIFSSPQEYLNSIKTYYFEYMNFSNEALYNSTYFSEKIVDYVFYLNTSDDIDVQQQLYKLNIEEVIQKIGDNHFIKSELLTILLHSFAQIENLELIEYLIKNHYLKLPDSLIKKKTIDDVRSKVKLAIGQQAPDFSWEEKGKEIWLSEQRNNEYYVIAFWSSSCSHCLTEIPQLYEYITKREDVYTIAFALENDELGFNHYTNNFVKWTNILGLGKWQNTTARAYEIHATPNYFVLDKNKKIIAKPEYFIDVKNYFDAIPIPVKKKENSINPDGKKIDSEVKKKQINEKPTKLKPINGVKGKALEITTYKVKKGDTLHTIAQAHKLTIKQLMRLNGLTSTNISIGKVLKIKADE